MQVLTTLLKLQYGFKLSSFYLFYFIYKIALFHDHYKFSGWDFYFSNPNNDMKIHVLDYACVLN